MKLEGVDYEINWQRFKKNSSFFIPCLDGAKTKQILLVTTKRLKLDIITKIVVEGDVRGLRVWRV